MKKFSLSALAFFCAFVSVNAQKDIETINLMSFNLRFNTPKDGPNQWYTRKDIVSHQILFHKADLIGTQESMYGMVLDIQERLEDGYKWFAADNTAKSDTLDSEWNAVFYNSNRFDLIKSGSFWLSENPDQFNVIGWDAQQGRVVVWGYFKDNYTGKDFYYFNTHFDHRGKVARVNSATLLLEKIKEMCQGKPVLVTGDLNTHPNTDPIKTLTGGTSYYKLFDAIDITQNPHYGPVNTFNDFGKGNHPGKIDYIFVNNKVEVYQHSTLSETWEDGKFSSDHFPIIASLRIK